MFKKAFKIKSNHQVKASERKFMKDCLLKNFSGLSELQADEILQKKDTLNIIKLVTHSGENVEVYCISKVPMLFTVQERIFPTVFLLWRFPNLIYSFTIQPQVFNFIASGADLMLPGVVTPPSQPKYGRLPEGSAVYVSLSNNVAAVAVGITSQSSESMERSNCKGKCVIVYHFLGDKLCLLDGFVPSKIPNMGRPTWLTLNDYEEDFPELGSCIKQGKVENETNNDTENEIAVENEPDNVINGKDLGNMNELIYYCFMGAIKYSKSLSLPIIVSNFYKLHMLPICPEGCTLDVKQTTYKKLKPFLDEMCKIGLITIKEIKKGVEAIHTINKEHPKFCEFYIPPENRLNANKANSDVKETSVAESYIVTQGVLPLFEAAGYRKGDTIQTSAVRKYVTDYIKEHNCQEEANAKLVKPKEALQKICKTENPITWEEVFEKVCDAMKNCFTVGSGSEQIVNKGKVSSITMQVNMRSGNKKVTLVDNLELFGVNLNEFAKECQHGVAASTSITPKTAGKKCDQLLVQGNQVVFIYNLLVDKYKIPKRYVKGLEHAPKRKK